MEGEKSKSYKDLIVWQKAMDLVEEVYRITEKLPSGEKYNLISQVRRSAVSIVSNIAEGSRRGTKKQFRYFLLVSFTSGAELETQIELIKRLRLAEGVSFERLDGLLLEVMKMLNTLTNSTFKT